MVMTDAPDRIWAACYGNSVVAEMTPAPLDGDGREYLARDGETVMAIIAIADHALDQWASWIESEYGGTTHAESMLAEVEGHRAALRRLKGDTP